MNLGRRTVLAALLASAGPAGFAAAQVLPPAAAPIRALDNGLLAVMKAGDATPFSRRFDMLAPVVDHVFDLPEILRASVGPRWSSFSPAEQHALITAFRQFTVATWVANFNEYNGERFEISPDLRSTGAGEVVSTRILGPGSDVSRIDYLMRQSSRGWRVVDVLLDGSISRVAVQRSDFRALLGDHEPSALIGSLRQKTAELSRGTLTR